MTHKPFVFAIFVVATLVLFSSCDSVSTPAPLIPEDEHELLALSLRDSSSMSSIYVYDINGDSSPKLIHGPVQGLLSAAFSSSRDTLFVYEHGYTTLYAYHVTPDSVMMLPPFEASPFLSQSYLQAIRFQTGTALLENNIGVGPARYSIWSVMQGIDRLHSGNGQVVSSFGPDSILVRRVQGTTPELVIADVESGISRVLSTGSAWQQFIGQGAPPIRYGDYDEESDLLILNTVDGALLVLSPGGTTISNVAPEGLILAPAVWGPNSQVIYVDRNLQDGKDAVFLLDIQANEPRHVLSSLDVPNTARIEQVSY